MINFRDQDQKKVFIHFAKVLNDDLALAVAEHEREIATKEEAERFAKLYWRMVDLSVIADRNKQEIDGVLGMQAIMEDLINIMGGYLERNGFAEQWEAEDGD
ncbi:hypothetical protein HCH_02258 [Hahella chejuensis KCTC 2396]|uniref:Uncharacterized protein n=1 Tax=Hahella chejuensis (strain KCTC 2396) TaxID=349521 RepID=Q2SJU0_HAHCH|nr:hypothetical protein [Hahella chejuensis]ABC29084.1 hypothetical protein HCH_02258 [Hahella chejuensis KCTC 2396]